MVMVALLLFKLELVYQLQESQLSLAAVVLPQPVAIFTLVVIYMLVMILYLMSYLVENFISLDWVLLINSLPRL